MEIGWQRGMPIRPIDPQEPDEDEAPDTQRSGEVEPEEPEYNSGPVPGDDAWVRP